MDMTVKKREEQAKRRVPAGSAPGTLIADPEAQPSELYVIAYGPDRLVEHPLADLKELAQLIEEFPVVWVNVNGLGSVDKIAALGKVFGIHRLALEDVVHTPQRPKAEPYGDKLLVIARLIRESLPLRTEQLSLFVCEGAVLTFQETPGTFFEPYHFHVEFEALPTDVAERDGITGRTDTDDERYEPKKAVTDPDDPEGDDGDS